MIFVISKLAFAVVRPLNLLILMQALGYLLRLVGWRRLGAGLIATSFVLFVVVGFSPLASWALNRLEERFPRPERIEPAPDGILVLGGALDIHVSGTRPGVVGLNDAAERMTEVARLTRLYPAARIVFSGGSDEVTPGILSEADVARQLFSDFGIAPERLQFEDRSRNTYENAEFSLAVAKPEAGQRWLLVTSAWHMPRAIGVFRQIGWPGVIAFPTDYRTPGAGGRAKWVNAATDGFILAEQAAKEYYGLVAYYWLGRTSALFPSP